MKIFITIPSFAVHGGIRIIVEHANRLAGDHQVSLFVLNNAHSNAWLNIDKRVKLVHDEKGMDEAELLIITSPHSIKFQNRKKPVRKLIFQQMMEHLFVPHDKKWQELCAEFYRSPYPVMSLATWNKEEMESKWRRRHPTYIIGNGVNLKDFPISKKKKDGRTILVEGWECTNPTKDFKHIAPAVARQLKQDGFKIIAYGIRPLQTMRDVPHEYYLCPDLKTLNKLYERATIMIKASVCDDRSCSPMEAMTKGTVTARAISKGDEDLKHLVNSLVCDYYDVQQLYNNARQLLDFPKFRNILAKRCYEHVQHYSWEYWMSEIKKIIAEV